jgi:concentrative nucleoside transporter, CNT family
MQHLQSALGVIALLAFAWAISENRRGVDWKSTGAALDVTFAAALLLIEVPQIKTAFALVNRGVNAIAEATQAGTAFVFGYAGGGPLPFTLTSPGTEFILAFQALPIVLVISVLTTLLFYWRILPPVVGGFSWILERSMGIGGAVGLSTAANIFLGMVESPLFIRPYLARLSRGELFMVMTGGMAGRHGIRALCDDPAQCYPRRRRPHPRRFDPRRPGRITDQRPDGAGTAGYAHRYW